MVIFGRQKRVKSFSFSEYPFLYCTLHSFCGLKYFSYEENVAFDRTKVFLGNSVEDTISNVEHLIRKFCIFVLILK